MRLIVVRHGETDWNRMRQAQGRADIELNENGRDQAFRLAGRLKNMRLDGIYASPLLRAYETAEIIAQRCHLPLEAVEALTEMDMGEWEGLCFPNIKERYPEEEALWSCRPDQSHLPGSRESTRGVEERVQNWADRLYEQKPGDSFVVVTHTWPAKLLILGALHVELRYIHSLRLDNAAMSIVERNETGWVVRLVNDVSHLRRGERWQKSP